MSAAFRRLFNTSASSSSPEHKERTGRTMTSTEIDSCLMAQHHEHRPEDGEQGRQEIKKKAEFRDGAHAFTEAHDTTTSRAGTDLYAANETQDELETQFRDRDRRCSRRFSNCLWASRQAPMPSNPAVASKKKTSTLIKAMKRKLVCEDFLSGAYNGLIKPRCCKLCDRHFVTDERVIHLPCGHFFHEKCAEDRFQNQLPSHEAFKVHLQNNKFKNAHYFASWMSRCVIVVTKKPPPPFAQCPTCQTVVTLATLRKQKKKKRQQRNSAAPRAASTKVLAAPGVSTVGAAKLAVSCSAAALPPPGTAQTTANHNNGWCQEIVPRTSPQSLPLSIFQLSTNSTTTSSITDWEYSEDLHPIQQDIMEYEDDDELTTIAIQADDDDDDDNEVVYCDEEHDEEYDEEYYSDGSKYNSSLSSQYSDVSMACSAEEELFRRLQEDDDDDPEWYLW